MNIHKLIRKVEAFLSSDERKRGEKRKFLKRVIKKLEKHERELQEQVETAPEEEMKERIGREIALTREEREKGIESLKALKKKKPAK